jgi:hypothetical protein
MKPSRILRSGNVAAVVLAAAVLGAGSALLGTCGPFTDVAADSFCPFVQEIFYLGITTGLTPTTFDPGAGVSRLQMAAFLSRSVDRTLRRSSLKASLGQFWTPQTTAALGVATIGLLPIFIESDGADLWVSSGNFSTGFVNRVRASDGKLLGTWTGADNCENVLVALGKVFVPASTSPGKLYRVDPTLPAGAVTTVASTIGNTPKGISFDGTKIWTANAGGSVSWVTPPGFAVATIAGFQSPRGIFFDGTNIWVTDYNAGTLLKLDNAAAVLQTVTVGTHPTHPVFDGTNIWVPNEGSASVSVVRASSASVLATLTGNGINAPLQAAFDGQRVLVTNQNGNSVSVWKAADLSVIGTFPAGLLPMGACSDGVDFWLAVAGSGVTKF